MSYAENLFYIWAFDDPISKIAPEIGVKLVHELNKKYSFQRWIAKGGEAVIVQAYDAMLEKDVCLKIALPQISDKIPDNTAAFHRQQSIFVKKFHKIGKEKRHIWKRKDTEITVRFEKGMENQRRLHQVLIQRGLTCYGYIPDVYEIGEPPKLFASMELIEGQSLYHWILGKSNDEILKLFLKILYLFEKVIHESYIVHGDVKPDNFFVINDSPIMLDFSVSKSMVTKRNLTRMSSEISNLITTSPEQKEHSVSRDYRDDIFSLAIVFWIMFTKKESVLWNKDVMRRKTDMLQVIKESYPSNVFPFPLKKIFEQATALKAKRYQDIVQFRSEFEEVVNIMCGSSNINSSDITSLIQRIETIEGIESRVKTLEEKNIAMYKLLKEIDCEN